MWKIAIAIANIFINIGRKIQKSKILRLQKYFQIGIIGSFLDEVFAKKR